MTYRLWLSILSWAMLLGLGACVSVQVTPYDLGVALQDQGDLPAASEHYKEELAIHPQHLRARFNLAEALYKRTSAGEHINHFGDGLRIKLRICGRSMALAIISWLYALVRITRILGLAFAASATTS